jgi:ribonuclease HI
MIAALDKKITKNPKKQTIRKLLEQQGAKITLLWVPNHVGVQENEEVDNVLKKSFNKN